MATWPNNLIFVISMWNDYTLLMMFLSLSDKRWIKVDLDTISLLGLTIWFLLFLWWPNNLIFVISMTINQRRDTPIDDSLLSRQFVEGLQDRTLSKILVRELGARPDFRQIREQAIQWCREEEHQTAALQYWSSPAPISTSSSPPPTSAMNTSVAACPTASRL